jgi:hypothetical protein
MAFLTLGEIDQQIRYRFDVENFLARHPKARIIELINQAYREIRDRLTADGAHVFVRSVEMAVTDVGPTSGYPGTILTAVGAQIFDTVREVHVKIGTSWIPLREVDIQDALNWSDLSCNAQPQAWCLAGLNYEVAVSPVTVQTIRVMVMPPNDAVRSFRIIGTLEFDGINENETRLMNNIGMCECVINWVGLKIFFRDEDLTKYQLLKQEYAESYAALLHRIKNRTPGNTRRVDVRGGGARGYFR